MSRVRILLAAVVVGLVSMWVYVLFLAFGPGRQPPVDRLDDPEFAVAAEDVCSAAIADVEDLPVASQAHSATERAAVLRQANGIFTGMLSELDGLTTLAPAGEQRDRTERWLDDWQVLLADREAYATALSDDPEAQLLISEKPGTGRHITGWIDEFALANKMDDCATPADA
ncbi:MAG TPA: hypothetical protein VK611_18460 [Acidimicrobiales bacterium]|nr:hypothetical protein [Acidimicrobiales bacterium]